MPLLSTLKTGDWNTEIDLYSPRNHLGVWRKCRSVNRAIVGNFAHALTLDLVKVVVTVQ